MKKEVLWILGLALGIGIIVTGLFLLPEDKSEGAVELPAEVIFEEQVMLPEPVGIEPEYPDNYDFDTDDDMGDVTRIVIEGGDSEEITNILSEKVIIDNEVVDQSKKSK